MSKLFNILAPFLVACFLTVERSLGGPSNELTVEEDGMRTSLRFIINHPINKNRPASFFLGPPLTYEEAFFTLLPALEKIDRLHVEEIIQLYENTDGLSTSRSDGFPLKDLWLIPGYYLMSLKEAVDTALTMRHVSDVWKLAWLPVFSSRAGDFIVFDLYTGRIWEVFTKELLEFEVAGSIDEFVRHIAHNLQRGTIFIGQDGMIDERMADDEVLNFEDPIVQKTGESFNLKVDQIFRRIHIATDNCPGVPNLEFNCGNMQHVCQNIRNAIINNNKPICLNRTTNSTQISKNRREACKNARCVSGESCDEYPFASTFQGGAGATIMCVPASENSSQGGQLSGFYTKNNVTHSSMFRQVTPNFQHI